MKKILSFTLNILNVFWMRNKKAINIMLGVTIICLTIGLMFSQLQDTVNAENSPIAKLDGELLDLIDQYANEFYKKTWDITLDQYKAWIVTIAWGEGGKGGYVAHSQVLGSDMFYHKEVGSNFRFSSGIGPFQLDRGGEPDNWHEWPTIKKLNPREAVISVLKWHYRRFGSGATLKDFSENSVWYAVKSNYYDGQGRWIGEEFVEARWKEATGLDWDVNKNSKNEALKWIDVVNRVRLEDPEYLYENNVRYLGEIKWDVSFTTDTGKHVSFNRNYPTWKITARAGDGRALFNYYYTYDNSVGCEVWVWDNIAEEDEFRYIFCRDYTLGYPTGALPQHIEGVYAGEDKLSRPALYLTVEHADYKISVKAGNWVEYKVTNVVEKAIIPISFESFFPKNWISVTECDSILVYVIEKTIVNFGNYSREFAVFNVTFNGQPLIPFWFNEWIQSIHQLPVDGLSFFLPVNESYWNCLRDMVKFWADKASQYGVQVIFDVRKCFYRFRVDGFFFGWVEVSANFDNYLGVLKDFNLRFMFTPDFVNEVRQRIGTIIVDGEPFEIQANKQYGIEITLNDSNIPQLVNNIEFGQAFAVLLDQTIKDGAVGAVITVKSQTITRTDVLVERLNASAYVASEKIIIDLNSTLSEGKILIVNVWKEAFPVQWSDEFQVFLDGKPIRSAENYDDALNLLNDGEAEYYVIVGYKSAQVTISIPYFSAHRIEIVKVPSLTAQLILYSIIACVVCLVAFGVYLLRRRIKHRSE